MHQSHPAKTYAEAEKRALDLRHNEEGDIRPDSHTRLLTHGAKTKHAIVMFHGFTNSPAQYTILAQIFFENGYNVLLPRLQYHGFIDVLTEDLEKLRASDIVSLTQESVDIAQGLGENVIVLGLSAGGVMAGWAAQHRSDISLAVVISPFLGLAFFPKWFSQTLKTVLPKIPNAFIWWDPRKKEKLPGPAHAYPRVSTHSMAEILIVGAQLLADAHAHPPQAKPPLFLAQGSNALPLPDDARALQTTPKPQNPPVRCVASNEEGLSERRESPLALFYTKLPPSTAMHLTQASRASSLHSKPPQPRLERDQP